MSEHDVECPICGSTTEQRNVDEILGPLRARSQNLDALLGRVLACLRVNMLRQTITTENDGEFERWIDGWQKRRKEA